MKRILQHPLPCSLLACVLALGLGLFGPGAATTQPPAKAPTVEPITHKGYTEKLSDQVSFDMVPIPGGTYLMGSPDGEKGRAENEGPQHPVTVKPFWMAKLEV